MRGTGDGNILRKVHLNGDGLTGFVCPSRRAGVDTGYGGLGGINDDGFIGCEGVCGPGSCQGKNRCIAGSIVDGTAIEDQGINGFIV